MSFDQKIFEISQLLYKKFANDQNSYAIQQNDGTYRRYISNITTYLIKSILLSKGSVALYQKNTDQTVNWICYDFDILKKNLSGESYDNAKNELERQVIFFVDYLRKIDIPFLLEFSGNRGYHVWIFFSEKVEYSIAYSILESILNKSNIEINIDLIDIDKFPSRNFPTGSVGKAVKIPLSKHKKSNNYSIAIKDIKETKRINELTDEILSSQIDLLSECNPITKKEIEKKLQECFIPSHIDNEESFRIKEITIKSPGFTFDDLMEYWKMNKPLCHLADLISNGDGLQHKHRLLIVGILNNLKLKNNRYFSSQLINQIFSKQQNYNKDITNKAIEMH